EVRWCIGTAAATVDKSGRVVRVSGVTVDITERKRAEERQNLLTREVDHRAKNALALAQSIVRLTRGESVKAYMQAVEGRISALGRARRTCRGKTGITRVWDTQRNRQYRVAARRTSRVRLAVRRADLSALGTAKPGDHSPASQSSKPGSRSQSAELADIPDLLES